MLRIVAAVDPPTRPTPSSRARRKSSLSPPGPSPGSSAWSRISIRSGGKYARNLDGSDANLERLEAAVLPEHRAGVAIARGAPTATICAFATEYDADVVVMGAHAYGWTERLLGTTASWVVDHIDRPLLVVRDASQVGPSMELRA